MALIVIGVVGVVLYVVDANDEIPAGTWRVEA